MDIQKWSPWNWFKDEESQESKGVPAQRQGQKNRDMSFPSLFSNDPLFNIHNEIDRMFDNVFSHFGTKLPGLREEGSGTSSVLLKPNVNIKETKKNYKITVEVPGVEEGDVKLELADGALTLSGEKKHETEEKDEHYHKVERSYGSFRRVLSLPEDADEDSIDAKFKNGVLTVTVPRKEGAKAKDETKMIAINKAA
jgi:HSP20 family protein